MKNYLFYASLFIACVSIISCKPKPPAEDGAIKGTYISVTDTPQANAPYTISLVEMPQNFAPALQSFAWANVGHKLLIVGGRTNGFHGFDSTGGSFPTKRANTYIYVVDIDSATTDSLPVPAKYFLQLSSTNMEGYNEDGKTLYCIGGYGSNCAADSPSCYQTYPLLTAIDIPAAMGAIQSGNAQALENSITSIEDERMRVTGGELHKIGEWFYLVVGQDYDSIYNYAGNPATGKYTQEIRRFQIEKKKDGKLDIKNYKAYNSLWDGNWKDQLHRRDLVVLESIMPDGTPGITVYGGVFTPVNDNAYTNPIYISQDSKGKPSFALDTVFSQQFCLYAAPSVALYNPSNKTMYTTILGGISGYFFDSTGKITPDGEMPFIHNVTTIVRNPNGGSAEYPQRTPVLPGRIGAEAVFIPANGIAMYQGTNRVIDMSKLPATGSVTLGLMYGGIIASTGNSNGPGPSTVANNKIYKVVLSR